MDYVIALLIFQGCLGGFDVMWNHEWKERLPTRPAAALCLMDTDLVGVGVFAWGLRDFGSGLALSAGIRPLHGTTAG